MREPSEARFPVLGSDGHTIPWSVAERAYAAYLGAKESKRSGPSIERVARWGGFSEQQLDEWCPGWRETAPSDRTPAAEDYRPQRRPA